MFGSVFQNSVVSPPQPLLTRFRHWLESIDVRQPQRAHWLCRWIPAQCPFERDVQIGSWQFHIPALCHLNPFYEQLMILRFRALCYLSDECGEDISPYCQ